MMKQHRNPIAQQVDSFTQLGNQELQRRRVSQALTAFENALRLSQKLDDAVIERTCCFNLGAALVAVGQNTTGLQYLENAIPPNNRRDGASNADLYYNMAVAYQQTRNWSATQRYIEMAIREFDYENNHVQVGDLAARLGTIQEEQLDDMESAATYYERAAEAYAKLGKVEDHTKVLNRQASCLVRFGNTEKSEPLLEKCLQSASSISDDGSRGQLYNDLGLSFMFCGNYEKAMTAFEQSIPLLKKYGDQQQLAVVTQNLGAAYNAAEKWADAVKLHQEASKLHAITGNRLAQGQCFTNLAFAYSQLADFERAGEAYVHGLQAARDIDDQRSQWQCLEGLGAVEYNLDHVDRAANYLKEAVSLCIDHQHQERLVQKLTAALEKQMMAVQLKNNSHVIEAAERLKIQTGSIDIPMETTGVEFEVEPEVIPSVSHVKQESAPKKPRRYRQRNDPHAGVRRTDSNRLIGIQKPFSSGGHLPSLLRTESQMTEKVGRPKGIPRRPTDQGPFGDFKEAANSIATRFGGKKDERDDAAADSSSAAGSGVKSISRASSSSESSSSSSSSSATLLGGVTYGKEDTYDKVDEVDAGNAGDAGDAANNTAQTRLEELVEIYARDTVNEAMHSAEVNLQSQRSLPEVQEEVVKEEPAPLEPVRRETRETAVAQVHKKPATSSETTSDSSDSSDSSSSLSSDEDSDSAESDAESKEMEMKSAMMPVEREAKPLKGSSSEDEFDFNATGGDGYAKLRKPNAPDFPESLSLNNTLEAPAQPRDPLNSTYEAPNAVLANDDERSVLEQLDTANSRDYHAVHTIRNDLNSRDEAPAARLLPPVDVPGRNSPQPPPLPPRNQEPSMSRAERELMLAQQHQHQHQQQHQHENNNEIETPTAAETGKKSKACSVM